MKYFNAYMRYCFAGLLCLSGASAHAELAISHSVDASIVATSESQLNLMLTVSNMSAIDMADAQLTLTFSNLSPMNAVVVNTGQIVANGTVYLPVQVNSAFPLDMLLDHYQLMFSVEETAIDGTVSSDVVQSLEGN